MEPLSAIRGAQKKCKSLLWLTLAQQNMASYHKTPRSANNVRNHKKLRIHYRTGN